MLFAILLCRPDSAGPVKAGGFYLQYLRSNFWEDLWNWTGTYVGHWGPSPIPRQCWQLVHCSANCLCASAISHITASCVGADASARPQHWEEIHCYQRSLMQGKGTNVLARYSNGHFAITVYVAAPGYRKYCQCSQLNFIMLNSEVLVIGFTITLQCFLINNGICF